MDNQYYRATVDAPGTDVDKMPAGRLVATREFDRPTVYIAGPMRGYKDLNYPAFQKAAEDWRYWGWQVISPAEEDLSRGERWTEESVEAAYASGDTPWVRHDVEIIMALQRGRDGVVALEGWQGSLGASAEIALAKWRGIKVYEYKQGNLYPMPPTLIRPSRQEATPTSTYDPREQDAVIRIFSTLLREVTRDGGKKRLAGTKPPWWNDDSHEAAIFSHLMKWKKGENKDKDSGAHPLVHLAWRALAIAYRETFGPVEPSK